MQSDSRGDTLRRTTKAALGGLAGCALALGGTQVAMSAVDYFLYPESLPEGGQVVLEDLGGNTAPGPFDGASADLRLKTSGTGTNFKLEVSGIAESGVGNVYGAHLHTYDCDEAPLSGPSAGVNGGPHYNHDVHYYGKAFPTAGQLPSETVAEVSPTTEAWFEFRPNAHGDAIADTFVPFVPVDADKEMSIVVHLLPTNPATGGAGGRQACFPIDASDWAPDPPTL
jgi:Cu/Zn superoxide dismutase